MYISSNNGEVTELGTIYAKVFKEVTGTKAHNKGEKFKIWSYIFEFPRRKAWTETKDEKISNKAVITNVLVKIKLPWKMNPDEFEVNDPVTVTYITEGKRWDKKDGSGVDVFNETIIKDIRFSDIKTDGTPAPARDVFTPPSLMPKKDMEEDDLPF